MWPGVPWVTPILAVPGPKAPRPLAGDRWPCWTPWTAGGCPRVPVPPSEPGGGLWAGRKAGLASSGWRGSGPGRGRPCCALGLSNQR